MPKKVFISYKWGSDAHNAWVERLYRGLRYRNVDAKLDKYDVAPGGSFSEYMTRGVREADNVLFVVTEAAVRAVEGGTGALAFELQIANARRIAAKGPFSIIPILREGNYSSTYLSDHRYLDFRDDSKFPEAFDELVHWLSDDVHAPSLGVNTTDPQAVTAALPFIKKCLVDGYAVNHPAYGEVGKIQLWTGNLQYVRGDAEEDRWDWPWDKDHFEWTLVWDEEKGVVGKARMATSDQ